MFSIKDKPSISINNFGPISESNIRINNLTIFIGPNNTGKSYLAMLVHLLMKELGSLSFHIPHRYRLLSEKALFQRQSTLREFIPSLSIKTEHEYFNEIKKVLSRQLKNIEEENEIEIEIPVEIVQFLGDKISNALKNFLNDVISEEFKRIFACSSQELVKFGKKKYQISVKSKDLEIKIESYGKKIRLIDFNLQYSSIIMILNFKRNFITFQSKQSNKVLYRYRARTPIRRFFDIDNKEKEEDLIEDIINRISRSLLEAISHKLNLMNVNEFYYLPATRAGLIQSQSALASAFLRLSSRALIDPINIPTLSGIVSDFLVNIIEKDDRKSKFSKLIKFLERDVLKGEITIDSRKDNSEPDIYYVTSEGKIPISRTSSMISEIAPIIIYFKYIIKESCFIIIEEPEAHLHPDAQRDFALFIVRLIRTGLKVIITTHSDFLILQLNNFIRLSYKSKEFRADLDYRTNDYIKPEEVNAFLFKYDNDIRGIKTEELNINEYGIDEDHFANLTDELYGESMKIDKMEK